MAVRTSLSGSRKNLISQIAKVSSLFIAGLLIVACGNKNNDNPAPAPVGPIINPTCLGGVNCVVGGGAEIYRGDSTNSWMGSGVQASLVFMATQYQNQTIPQPYSYNNGYNNGYPNTGMYPNYNNLGPTSYNGPVTVQGQLNSNSTGGMWGGTLLPQGGYQVVTIQQGQWIGGTFQNVKVQFAGGAMTFIGTMSGYIGARNSFWGYTWQEIPRQGTIVGQIIIESVNGQPYYNVINF